MYPDNPYFLLTPGPLSTSKAVRAAMLQDWCTWDIDYKEIVQSVRRDLLSIADLPDTYTTVLMQGSGTFSVEAMLGTAISKDDKVLVIQNGAYGKRIGQIANRLKLNFSVLNLPENQPPSAEQVSIKLAEDPSITHVAMVHCETTTGMLNTLEDIVPAVKAEGRIMLVDAMSSFGGIPINIEKLGIDFLVSSANKCIQGVPGFGFVIAKEAVLKNCESNAHSLALDLYDQWQTMEKDAGKWRYTSPTHTVRAFKQALQELKEEGGITARYQRYQTNHRTLVDGMRELGFDTFLPDTLQSPIITSFYNPSEERFQFEKFYQLLKQRGFVIYPGKVSEANTFRVGNIGHVFPEDFEAFIAAVNKSCYWKTGFSMAEAEDMI